MNCPECGRAAADRYDRPIHQPNALICFHVFHDEQADDASWATFFSMLSYKAEGAGRELVEVDSRYTSQTCPSCGNRKKKPLSERQHNCLVCGYAAHRDTAAAQIVLARAWPSGANLTEVIV